MFKLPVLSVEEQVKDVKRMKEFYQGLGLLAYPMCVGDEKDDEWVKFRLWLRGVRSFFPRYNGRLSERDWSVLRRQAEEFMEVLWEKFETKADNLSWVNITVLTGTVGGLGLVWFDEEFVRGEDLEAFEREFPEFKETLQIRGKGYAVYWFKVREPWKAMETIFKGPKVGGLFAGFSFLTRLTLGVPSYSLRLVFGDGLNSEVCTFEDLFRDETLRERLEKGALCIHGFKQADFRVFSRSEGLYEISGEKVRLLALKFGDFARERFG